MINKTNNIVYAYKLKLPPSYDKDYFKSNFSQKNLKDNIFQFEESDYSGALVFEKAEDEGLFFKFSKIRDKNFLITNKHKNTQK